MRLLLLCVTHTIKQVQNHGQLNKKQTNTGHDGAFKANTYVDPDLIYSGLNCRLIELNCV